MARDQDGREITTIIDLVLVRDMLKYIQDVRTARVMGSGLSNHFVVLCKVRLMGKWIKRRGSKCS